MLESNGHDIGEYIQIHIKTHGHLPLAEATSQSLFDVSRQTHALQIQCEFSANTIKLRFEYRMNTVRRQSEDSAKTYRRPVDTLDCPDQLL
jgi:hypothetical protein